MTLVLPGVLADIAELVGVDAACRLAVELGGTRVYVATTPGADSLIATAIGMPAALRLGEVWGGDYLTVPNAKRTLVCWLHAAGESAPQIARRLKMNERTVRRILSERPTEARQFSLF